jgi:hypothetical protein
MLWGMGMPMHGPVWFNTYMPSASSSLIPGTQVQVLQISVGPEPRVIRMRVHTPNNGHHAARGNGPRPTWRPMRMMRLPPTQ